MTDEARQLFDAFTPLRWPVEVDDVERVLGVRLVQLDPPQKRFEGSLPAGAFGEVVFGVSRLEPEAFLTLSTRKSAGLTESGMNMNQYGTLAIVDINPRILPEGTITFGGRAQLTGVRWEFKTASRVLRTLRFDWRG
jgi:hypothetical protein